MSTEEIGILVMTVIAFVGSLAAVYLWQENIRLWSHNIMSNIDDLKWDEPLTKLILLIVVVAFAFTGIKVGYKLWDEYYNPHTCEDAMLQLELDNRKASVTWHEIRDDKEATIRLCKPDTGK